MVRSSHPVAGSSGPWIRNRTFPKAFGRPPSGGLNRSSLQSGRADRRNRAHATVGGMSDLHMQSRSGCSRVAAFMTDARG